MDTDRHGSGSGSASARAAEAGYQLPAVVWTDEGDVDVEITVQEAVAVQGPVPPVPAEAPAAAEPGTGSAAVSSAEAGAEVEAEAEAELVVPAVAEAGTGAAPGRVSRPMIAAAATVGVVLISLPLVLSHLGGPGPRHSPSGPPPAGFTQQSSGGGFVPGADAHGNVGAGAGAAGVAVAGPSHAAAHSPVSAPAVHGAASVHGAPARGPGHTGGSATDVKTGGKPAAAAAAPKKSAARSSAPAPPSYHAVAGAWCGNSSTGFQQYGWFDQGQAGWRTNSAGGYSGAGCNGRYTSVPMSGEAGHDDGNSVVWTFNTGAVSQGSCRLSVYVPDDRDVKAVGGAPAYYTVQNSSVPRSGTIGSFTVDQVKELGQWVGVGSYRVSGGRIAVMLHTRGQDWVGGKKTYAHLAAAAVRADCTG